MYMMKGSRNVSQGFRASSADFGSNAIVCSLEAAASFRRGAGWPCPFFRGNLEASLAKMGPSFVLECPDSAGHWRLAKGPQATKKVAVFEPHSKPYDPYQAKT
jgi:hypothetical protein